MPTAETLEIAWTGVHLGGVIVVACLVAIVWLRRQAVIDEERPQTPKAPRIRSANRQLRDRGVWCGFHAICAVLGLFRMADALWLEGITGWVLVGGSVAVVVVAVIDLYEETKSR